jgi:hypothetical protein
MSLVAVAEPAAAGEERRLNLNRPRRVTVLLMGVMVLSLADLIVTLAHLRSIGMMEANPIAAFIIRSTQSPISLIAFKALSVGVCVALLYRIRRHVEGEFAAWFAVAILAFMSFQWHSYTRHLDNPELYRLVQNGAYGERWLVLD